LLLSKKEITVIHHECQSTLQEPVRTSFTNRLDDLQENLADLQHKFGKKYQKHSVTDNAMQLIKDQQIAAARRQIEQAEQNLFDL